MYEVQSDLPGQLLVIRYSGHVEAGEMPFCVNRVNICLAGMKPGFRLLADFTAMESMDSVCAFYMAQIMDLCSAKEVGHIARVIPDPHKDIGLNILSFFHYAPDVRITTYECLEDAQRGLED
jgi:hypothetical protein